MNIQISPQTRVKSPFELCDEYKYEGNIEGVDLLQQTQNYLRLKESLSVFGFSLSHILFAKFKHELCRANGDKYHVIRYHFLAHDDTRQIYWRKYESRAMGSGQNLLYFNGHKYKLTDWLRYDAIQRHEVLRTTGVTS